MIKRQLFNELKKHLKKKEISFIVGPRQAGKTTLMQLLRKEVEREGRKTVFFNLDIEADKQYFTSQDQLLRKIALEVGGNGYVFIDEIQRKENAGLFLKGLFDMNLPYKLIVSGSGSVELKEKIHESLFGRKRIFELSTINFIEFVNYRTNYQYETKLVEFFSLDPVRAQRLLEEYLRFGGYPRVVLEETVEEKRRVISELYQSYLERDIVSFLGVKKTESFTSLVRLMASQVGQLVNVSELANTLGINTATVNDYLWYLQKTFLIDKVTPFFKNLRKEISKAPSFYFYDLGMRNYALGGFGGALPVSESGFLFQNFLYNIIKDKVKNTSFMIHYWRTTNKAEVDFVIDKTTEIIPIEVKYGKLAELKMTRSFLSFLASYHPKTGYIVHLGKASQKTVNGIKIKMIPFSQFVLQKE